MSHMTQRQLQWLCTLSTRIGIDANVEVSWGAIFSSCSRGTAHPLSTNPEVASQDVLSVGNQLANRSADPSWHAIYFAQLQPVRERGRQPRKQSWPRKLNPPCRDHHLYLIDRQLSQRFSRAEALVAHHQHVCGRPGPQASFSPPETQNVRRLVRDHRIDRVGVQPDLGARKSDLIQ